MVHPRNILLGAQAGAISLPVCDHYCGVEARITKSLQLQAEMMEEFGACVFDVTLDCEDGAPVGGELEHANMVAAVVSKAFLAPKIVAISGNKNQKKTKPRVAVRLHAVDHVSFESDINTIVGHVGQVLSHVMVPKVDTVADVVRAVKLIDEAYTPSHQKSSIPLPIHVLLESPKAIHNAFDIAAHPRVQSLSFG
jgi:citrate lyase subunit beta / citryl-CoA lyase